MSSISSVYLSDVRTVETIRDELLGGWSASGDHIAQNSKSRLRYLPDTECIFGLRLMYFLCHLVIKVESNYSVPKCGETKIY